MHFSIFKEIFPRFGAGAVYTRNGTVLLSGGYHSQAYDDIIRFISPQDLCTVSKAQDDCSAIQWCQYCHFGTSNNTSCISSFRNDASSLCDGATIFLPPRCSILTPCTSSQTCGSCLSNDLRHHRSCHWCPCAEKCVNSSSRCLEGSCFLQHSTSLCYFSQCAAATCDDCIRKGCIWTNQLEHVSGITVRVFRQPNQWQCFTSEIGNSITRQLPDNYLFTVIDQLQQCPLTCSSFITCSACTSALGHLAGPIGCAWILKAGKCMSHIEVLINCPVGNCGIVISIEQSCNEPCHSFSYCHSCLQTGYCTWCHQNGSNGEGFCVNLEDTIECLSSYTVPVNEECPAENECINGHNSCFHDQQCNDVSNGFVCTCPSGYMTG